ncbi:MAG: DUF4880 domain-containing protein, partial [Pseudomonadota bacterium]
MRIALDKDYSELSRAAHEWRTRLADPRATDADRNAFEKWLEEDRRHEDAYDRAVAVWSSYDTLRRQHLD